MTQKSVLKVSLLIFVLSLLGGVIFPSREFAEAAQTINKKALGSIDDIVKEIGHGELSIPKKGLLFFRSDYKIDDVNVFATVFSADAQPSTKRKLWENPNATVLHRDWVRMHHYLSPAVSRRLYNGKRALMFHNLAPDGQFKYYFKTLSNTRNVRTTDITPDGLVNLVNISDFGEYTPPAFSNSEENFTPKVFGSGVMAVNGYEREIFVAASGPNYSAKDDKAVRLEFFALSADSEGNMTQEPLTALTHETPCRGELYITSLAVGDFDGDKYNNEVALMINTRTDIYVFVYRLILSNGNLALMSLGDPKGIHVHNTDKWRDDLESQPATDMAAGDFDRDGTSEIAVLYKLTDRRSDLKSNNGWPDGPAFGDICCKIYKWNAEKIAFDTESTIKTYSEVDVGLGLITPTIDMGAGHVTGFIGLRAVAADLDGDGKDEIVTLVLGYFHFKHWNWQTRGLSKFRQSHFYAYPHLAVWKFDKGIKPVHDDAHVRGGGESGQFKYNRGPLYELGKNTPRLLMNQPHLKYVRYFDGRLDVTEGRSPDSIRFMYALDAFSIAAGPFTGTIGKFRTVDDIAVSWFRDDDNAGFDSVTIFKSKVNAEKKFDGFEDGKLVIEDNTKIGLRWRGLVAVDLASEGVELNPPVHLIKKKNRNYVAVLNAIPYHVDTLNEDGTALQYEPRNFTYSDSSNNGNMTVSYGASTTDSKTSTVKEDLSQSIETIFLADPKGDDKKVQDIFGKVKGVTAFASGVTDIGVAIKTATMSQQELMEKGVPQNPIGWLNGALDFITDKVDSIDQRTNAQTTSTIIDKEIIATTHDAILFSEPERHIWRYPVTTRPLPMWLALGSRVDSTPADPYEVSGDRELYITFTMNEHAPLNTLSSINDSKYQPLHEEGNFFSYPPNIGDVEGYNDAGVLADAATWAFSNTAANASIKFMKASSDMQHTEKNVTPSTFTQTVSFFDRLFNGKNATGVKMPASENPKTFSKEYNTSERVGYNLQGSSILTGAFAADHVVKMQPFVAKEGAMTFATAVELSSKNNPKLWDSDSIYRKYPDPSLYLPLKFTLKGDKFEANPNEKAAMGIRGIRFYVPDFAFYSDNRLMKGLKYEIRVPLYNASFKDTGNFIVTLSYTESNDIASVVNKSTNKQTIGTHAVSLGGWNNKKNNNKGTAVFEWTPPMTLTPKQYYFYVEIDPVHRLSEVHEERHMYGSTAINDYGGNNTGFYPFYVFNVDDTEVEVANNRVVTAGSGKTFSAADDEMNLNPLSFEDGDGNNITDMAAFITNHSKDSYVSVTAKFNYSGPEVPYAYFVGYVLTPSGKQKFPNASINTIVDFNDLDANDIDKVFMLEDVALFNGTSEVTFSFSPSEVISEADDIAAVTDAAKFGLITITEEEIKAAEDELYKGEDPTFELDAIPDNIVSSSTSKTYTIKANENVFWLISSVKLNGTSTSEAEEDDRKYLDINLEVVSDDADAYTDYGKTAIITVSSLAGITPKGEYKITVQKSANGGEWTNAEVLTFNTENAEDDGNNKGTNNGVTLSSSSGGCNTGLGILAFFISGFIIFRKKN